MLGPALPRTAALKVGFQLVSPRFRSALLSRLVADFGLLPKDGGVSKWFAMGVLMTYEITLFPEESAFELKFGIKFGSRFLFFCGGLFVVFDKLERVCFTLLFAFEDGRECKVVFVVLFRLLFSFDFTVRCGLWLYS